VLSSENGTKGVTLDGGRDVEGTIGGCTAESWGPAPPCYKLMYEAVACNHVFDLDHLPLPPRAPQPPHTHPTPTSPRRPPAGGGGGGGRVAQSAVFPR
jgi:hypothetical protein